MLVSSFNFSRKLKAMKTPAENYDFRLVFFLILFHKEGFSSMVALDFYTKIPDMNLGFSLPILANMSFKFLQLN